MGGTLDIGLYGTTDDPAPPVVTADITRSRGFVRFHLNDRWPLTLEAVAGSQTLGKGWLVVSETEHFAHLAAIDGLDGRAERASASIDEIRKFAAEGVALGATDSLTAQAFLLEIHRICVRAQLARLERALGAADTPAQADA